MRYLTDTEIELVAGGSGSDSTVTVTAGSGVVTVGGGGGDSGGGGGDYTDPQDPEGGGGGGGGDQTAGGDHSIGDVLHEFVGAIETLINKASENQEKVAAKFDPSNVLSQFWTTAPDGKVFHGYAMTNGEAFLDVSGDGIVDMEAKTDAGGNLWVNTGEGWYEAGSHG